MDRFLSALSSLGSPVRVEILRELRRPRSVGDIRIWSDHGERRRLLSRPSIAEHVDRLAAAGLVRCEPRDGARIFVVNDEAILALAEDLRALASGKKDPDGPGP